MDFVLLLLINIAILALMYLVLRHQLMKNYSNENFLDTLQKEVNAIMTDLNQATETNVQIITAEAEKIKNLQQKVEKRIVEMQQIFTMLDRADGRYNEILSNTRRRGVNPQEILRQSSQAVPAEPPSPAVSAQPRAMDNGSSQIQMDGLSPQAGQPAAAVPEAGNDVASGEIRSGNDVRDRTDTRSDVNAPLRGTSPSLPDELSPRERVLGLYNQGRDLQEISELTRIPIGEIELIIELSK